MAVEPLNGSSTKMYLYLLDTTMLLIIYAALIFSWIEQHKGKVNDIYYGFQKKNFVTYHILSVVIVGSNKMKIPLAKSVLSTLILFKIRESVK